MRAMSLCFPRQNSISLSLTILAGRTYLDVRNKFESLNIDLDLVACSKGCTSLVLFLDLNALDPLRVPFRVRREIQ